MDHWGENLCKREEPLITSAIKTSRGSAFENKNKIRRVQLKRYLNSQKNPIDAQKKAFFYKITGLNSFKNAL